MKKLTQFNTVFIIALFACFYLNIQVGQSQNKPYMEEEITFKNGDITLGGTLTLPKTKGKHPAIVLISGSGAQNRDSELLGFKVFKLIAEHLNAKGIAVLRYDDRGVGKSSGKTATSTSADFANDVIAAVKLLEKRSDINPKQIGLLGHSEGGMIAPLVYQKYPKVAFLISMAGTTVAGSEVIWGQTEAMLVASGKTKEEIAAQKKRTMMMFETIKTDKGWDELTKANVEYVLKEIEKLPDAQKSMITDPKKYATTVITQQLNAVKTPWYRFFIAHDPKESLENTKCPVLAVFGAKDLQVLPSQNKPALEQAMKKGGNKDYTIETLAEANHLFQKANTGLPTEYASLPKEFVADFFPTITDWLLKRVTVIK